MKRAAGLLVACLLFASLQVPAMAFAATSTTKCLPPNPNTTFTVLSGAFGTEAGPGDTNVPFSVTLQYLGPCSAVGIISTLQLPSGFADTSGNPAASAFTNSVGANGSIFTITFDLNIAQTARTGTYNMALGLVWNSGDNQGLNEQTQTTAHFNGKVNLVYSSGTSYLSPNGVNNLTLTLSNQGTGNASEISETVSAPVGVSLLGRLSGVQILDRGASTPLPISLYVPGSAAGSSVVLTLTTTYSDGYSSQHVTSQQLGFIVSSVQQPAFSLSAAPEVLTEGVVNPVTISLTNSGPSSLSNATLTVTPTAPSYLSGTDGAFDVGTVPVGSSGTATAMVVAASSPVLLQVSVSYFDGSGIQRTSTRTLTLQAASTASQFEIQVSPQTLLGGSVNSVTAALLNTGSGDMSGVHVSISPQTPLSLVGSDGSYYLGSVAEKGSAQFALSFYVGQSQPSTGGFIASVSYTNAAGQSLTETRTLTFLINNSPAISPVGLSVTPTTLLAGSTNNITLTFSNLGRTALDSFSVSYALPAGQATWLHPTTSQLSSLAPGTSFTVSGQVFAPSTQPPSTSLQISISYFANGTLTQETRSVGLLTKGNIDLKVTGLTVAPSPASPGQISSITLTVTNLGVSTASAVTAVAEIPQGFKVFGPSSSFIGDMQPSTPTTFTFSVLVDNSTKAGDYSIPVAFSYLDNLRNPLTTTSNVPVLVFLGSSVGGGGTGTGRLAGGSGRTPGEALLSPISLIIIALVAFAMLALGFFIGRRRSRKVES